MFREWERETISTIMEMNSDISTIMEICDMMCFGKGWCSLALQRDYH
jgi:hypothetical protein